VAILIIVVLVVVILWRRRSTKKQVDIADYIESKSMYDKINYYNEDMHDFPYIHDKE